MNGQRSNAEHVSFTLISENITKDQYIATNPFILQPILTKKLQWFPQLDYHQDA